MTALRFRRPLLVTVLLALLLALLWWLLALAFQQITGVYVWGDQRSTFTCTLEHLADPYSALAFPYVPWTALLLAPFSLPPTDVSVLLQLALYFVALALVVRKFGGGTGVILLVLTSALALDTALEINIEWLVCLGLLVPRTWSGPFLLVKPQAALGYGLSFRGHEMVRGGLFALVIMGLSWVVWPDWPALMLDNIRANTLGDWGSRINMAPSVLLPLPVAWGIGGWLGWRAFCRKDPIFGVLAWQFFVPYATFYGMLPAYALFTVRWPRVSLVANLTLWALYGSMLLPFLTGGN